MRLKETYQFRIQNKPLDLKRSYLECITWIANAIEWVEINEKDILYKNESLDEPLGKQLHKKLSKLLHKKIKKQLHSQFSKLLDEISNEQFKELSNKQLSELFDELFNKQISELLGELPNKQLSELLGEPTKIKIKTDNYFYLLGIKQIFNSFKHNMNVTNLDTKNYDEYILNMPIEKLVWISSEYLEKRSVDQFESYQQNFENQSIFATLEISIKKLAELQATVYATNK